MTQFATIQRLRRPKFPRTCTGVCAHRAGAALTAQKTTTSVFRTRARTGRCVQTPQVTSRFLSIRTAARASLVSPTGTACTSLSRSTRRNVLSQKEPTATWTSMSATATRAKTARHVPSQRLTTPQLGHMRTGARALKDTPTECVPTTTSSQRRRHVLYTTVRMTAALLETVQMTLTSAQATRASMMGPARIRPPKMQTQLSRFTRIAVCVHLGTPTGFADTISLPNMLPSAP